MVLHETPTIKGTSNRKKIRNEEKPPGTEFGDRKQQTLKKHTLEIIGSWNLWAQEAWENVTIEELLYNN